MRKWLRCQTKLWFLNSAQWPWMVWARKMLKVWALFCRQVWQSVDAGSIVQCLTWRSYLKGKDSRVAATSLPTTQITQTLSSTVLKDKRNVSKRFSRKFKKFGLKWRTLSGKLLTSTQLKSKSLNHHLKILVCLSLALLGWCRRKKAPPSSWLTRRFRRGNPLNRLRPKSKPKWMPQFLLSQGSKQLAIWSLPKWELPKIQLKLWDWPHSSLLTLCHSQTFRRKLTRNAWDLSPTLLLKWTKLLRSSTRFTLSTEESVVSRHCSPFNEHV